MNLIDRYLYAVQQYLPTACANRDDIVAELREALESRIEERERALGRSLNDNEIAGLLKAFGHPRIIAAQFGEQHALIGAALMPFYKQTLVMVLTLVLAAEIIATTAEAIVRADAAYFYAFASTVWDSLWIVTGIVTAAFAVLERLPFAAPSRALDWILHWDPRRLPEPGTTPAPQFGSLIECIANLSMLVVLLNVDSARRVLFFMILGPVAAAPLQIAFTNAWQPLYLATIAATAMLGIVSLATFVQPLWRRLRSGAHLVANACMFAGVILTLRAGTLIVPAAASHASTAQFVDRIATYALLTALAGFTIAVAFNLRTFFFQTGPESRAVA